MSQIKYKVICIDATGSNILGMVSHGKIYDAVDTHSIEYYSIVDDKGEINFFYKTRFRLLHHVRE